MLTPEIREIQAALALTREGCFAGAAKELAITQPAVSQRIAKLEQIFGFSMFHRRSEGTTLTEEGKMLLPFIEEIDSEFSSVLRRVSYWNRANGKQLNVFIDGSLKSQAIHFKAYSEGYAGGGENWSSPGDCEDWIDALTGFGADLVIAGSFLGGGEIPGIRTAVISRERGVTVAWNPGYYSFSKENFSFPDAIATTVIMPADSMAVGFRKFILGWCASTYGLQLTGLIEADTEADAIQVCKLGMGVLLLPGEADGRVNPEKYGLETAHSFQSLLPNAYTFGVRYRADEKNPQALGAIERLAGIEAGRLGRSSFLDGLQKKVSL